MQQYLLEPNYDAKIIWFSVFVIILFRILKIFLQNQVADMCSALGLNKKLKIIGKMVVETGQRLKEKNIVYFSQAYSWCLAKGKKWSPNISDRLPWRQEPIDIYQTERTWGWFGIKTSCYQCRKSHRGDKTILRSSYLHNEISCTGKTTSLYWIRAEDDIRNGLCSSI